MSNEVQKPKRGRPAGKNRVPLSAEERRKRNADYERQRREEMGEAIDDLMNLFNCEPNTTTKRLLTLVHDEIKSHQLNAEETARKKRKRTVQELMCQNLKITEEIKKLEEEAQEFRLEDWVDLPKEE